MYERVQSDVSVRGLRVWVLVVALLFGAFGVAPDAHAQSDSDEAKQLAQEGAKAFVKKDYAMAVTYFQRAASLDPNPVLLYNLSLAQSRLGNVEDARDAAQRAIALGDEGVPEDTRIKLRARLAGYDSALAARSMTDALAPEPRAEAGETEPGTGGGETEVGSTRQQDDEGSSIGTLGWAGVGTAAVGVGLLAGAGLVNAGVRADIEAYDEARRAGELERARGLGDDVETGQQTGQILLYSGAGLAAVGAGLLVFDMVNGGESETRARLMTAPTRDGASVTFRLQF